MSSAALFRYTASVAGRLRLPAFLLGVAALAACTEHPWNSPYPAADAGANIVYSSFEERPKHLDPARSYSSNEATFTGQIYEPPLQYHYLKRPYTLIPLTAESVPVPHYFDRDGRPLAEQAPDADVAFSVYDIRIKSGIYYQPHPAFALNESGEPLSQTPGHAELKDIHAMSDFSRTGTRELVAADYVYQIKRLAHPRLHSPILGVMSEYIVGLKEYAAQLDQIYSGLVAQSGEDVVYLDLAQYPFAGVETVDRYTYRIKVKGKYPQLLYWLAMPFFAPIPPEVDRFHSSAQMEEKNLTLDWYPVGTGPYMLTVNNPNRQMVLERNPNFHPEFYPDEGDPGDREAGLLGDAGKRLPFIDKVVFSLKKETIPYWNKFLQGYYDTSGISSDSFDQAVRMGSGGEATLTDQMKQKGIRLQTAVSASIFYTGFNMLDPVVGGYSERQRLLRQAISIALDYEEFISIFANGRGIASQGPIPPGIFGYVQGETGINPYVYAWGNGAPRRKSIEEARSLLQAAGYADGVDAETGRPLVLNLDITAGGPDDKARLKWFRKQFEQINIQSVIRNTDYNRFQDKMRNGNAQIFMWGWNADYPDPENFLFLLYGPSGKVRYSGENAANYANPDFDRLFEQMKTMSDGPERQRLIDSMVDIVRRDAPWIWGFHPKSFSLYHAWLSATKPNLMANNLLKYRRIDPDLRERLRVEWNHPVVWPLLMILVLLAAVAAPAAFSFIRRQYHTPAITGDNKTRSS